MKIAFVHIMKTAGSTVNYVLTKNVLVPKRYLLLFPGAYRDDDWTEEELRDFLEISIERPYVHNHAKNWTTETIRAYLNEGWFTFSFYRHPGDQWCSYYFWSKESNKNQAGGQKGKSVVISDNRTLDEFLKLGWSESSDVQKNHPGVQDVRRNLDLPECWREMNFVAIYSNQNFESFLSKYFGKGNWKPKQHNPSSNRGYQYYRNQGSISDESHELLMDSQRYRDYQTLLELPHERGQEHFLPPKSTLFFESSPIKAQLVRYVVLLQCRVGSRLFAQCFHHHPGIQAFGDEFDTFPQTWANQKKWLNNFYIRLPLKDDAIRVLGFQTNLGSVSATNRFRDFLKRKHVRVIHVATENPVRMALYDVCSNRVNEQAARSNLDDPTHEFPKARISVQDFREALGRIQDPAELEEYVSSLNVPKLHVTCKQLLRDELTVMRRVCAFLETYPFRRTKPTVTSANPTFDVFGDLNDRIANLDELRSAFPEYEQHFADESWH